MKKIEKDIEIMPPKKNEKKCSEEELEKTIVVYVPQGIYFEFLCAFPEQDENGEYTYKPTVKDNLAVKEIMKYAPDGTLYIELRFLYPLYAEENGNKIPIDKFQGDQFRLKIPIG